MNVDLKAQLRFDSNARVNVRVVQLARQDVVLHLSEDAPDESFAWLRFDLPDKRGRCTALLQIQSKSGAHLSARFKHVFPDSRRALRDLLDRNADLAAAEQAHVA